MSENYRKDQNSTLDVADERLNGDDVNIQEAKVTMSDCLEMALNNVKGNGYLLTLPELLSIKLLFEGQQHDYWNEAVYAYSEENKGIDVYGQLYSKGTEVVTVVHGGGLLTPERIKTGINEGLVYGNVKYTQEEFDMLLSGEDALGNHISMYPFHNLHQKDVMIPKRQFGIVIPYELIKRTQAPFWNEYAMKNNPFLVVDYQKNCHQKNLYPNPVFWDEYTIRSNPLANARAGNPQLLLAYHEVAKNEFGDLGCSHRFNRAYSDQPQGYLLALGANSSGMYGVRADQEGKFAAYYDERSDGIYNINI